MRSSALTSRFELLRETSKLPAALLEPFASFLETAPEERLFRMSPVRYASAHGLSEPQAIDLFLHATHAGLLDFCWGILCPACKGFLTTESAVKSLAQLKHCSLCHLDIALDDDSVEVAFTVSPPVRRIRFHEPHALDYQRDGLRLYFSSSVEWAPEVQAMVDTLALDSARVPRSGSTTFRRSLTAGPYMLMAPTEHAWLRVIAEPGGPSSLELDLAPGTFALKEARVGTGPVEITVRNRALQDVLVGMMTPLQQPGPPQNRMLPYLTAKRLVTSQTFRDLFRTESIPAKGGLQLKNLTVLFTDLKGSTELYERIGDLRAFELVQEHFELLRSLITRRGGAMVKTIGDAIMASFPEPAPALEAAAGMRQEVSRVGGKAGLELKIGMHAGPCIAVELNERLDYFGQTVNIAARVQGVASANEITLTDAIWRSPGAAEAAQRAGLEQTTTQEQLKGLEGCFTIHHLS